MYSAGLVALLLGMAIPSWCNDAEWEQIVATGEKARAILQEESRAPANEVSQLRALRIQLFREAAGQLLAYVRKGGLGNGTTMELRGLFRRGLYEEYGYLPASAFTSYRECKKHPKLSDAGAVWGDGSQRIETLLPERMAVVGKLLSPSGSGHTMSWVYRGKGGILVDHLQGEEKEYSDEEKAAIRGEWTLNDHSGLEKRAKALAAELEKRDAVLKPVEYMVGKESLIVVGVLANQRQVRTLAEMVESYSQSLRREYFDSGHPSPTLLVYANLQDPNRISPADVRRQVRESPPRNPMAQVAQQVAEPSLSMQIADRLSQALHRRRRTNLEGYFEPLDHSLVLRKGLVGDEGSLYLGTGSHEVVHALMASDFPNAPKWLDEGVAALHEEMSDGKPIDNYRLYAVQYALRIGKLPALSALLDDNAPGWNGQERLLMAATARYFCLYLHGRKSGSNDLASVYKRLRARAYGAFPAADRSVEVLTEGGKGLSEVEAEFRDFVQKRDARAIASKWGRLQHAYESYVDDMPRR